jgi:hypothetical protein
MTGVDSMNKNTRQGARILRMSETARLRQPCVVLLLLLLLLLLVYGFAVF